MFSRDLVGKMVGPVFVSPVMIKSTWKLEIYSLKSAESESENRWVLFHRFYLETEFSRRAASFLRVRVAPPLSVLRGGYIRYALGLCVSRYVRQRCGTLVLERATRVRHLNLAPRFVLLHSPLFYYTDIWRYDVSWDNENFERVDEVVVVILVNYG